MTQTKVNYAKKVTMSMKLMCVKTKELSEKATKRKKYEFLMNNVKSLWLHHRNLNNSKL